MEKFAGILALVLLLMLAATPAEAQKSSKREKVTNLPDFDQNYYHFGFVLSLNTSSLIVGFKEETIAFEDSVLAVENVSQPGFNLAMLASLDMTGNWHLRFIPALSFNERILQYTLLLEDGTTESIRKDVSSTNIDFPLLLKYRTDRMNNIALYAIIGGMFSLDVATQKNVNNNNSDVIVVKIDNTDYSVSGGVGVDFFLPYFKFGIELKVNIGVKNLFIDDGTRFAAPLQSLRSQSIVLSFNFEG